MCFQWLQLKHIIPKAWKTSIKLSYVNVSDLLVQDHHLVKGARILTLGKLSANKLYSILTLKFTNKHSSNSYFEKFFEFD